MGFISELFGYPLGYIMWAIYSMIPSYAFSILLFTIVTKIILFPLSIKQQKSQAAMTAFQPKLQALQKKYGNNKEKLQAEQMKLYSEEGINPMSSCLPLLIQFPVLFGIIDVVYRPMTHIMHYSKDLISQASTIAFNVITEAQVNGAAWATSIKAASSADVFAKSYQNQLFIVQAYNQAPDQFSSMGADFIDKVSNFNMNLFGVIDLGSNPSVAWPIILIPIFAGLSQLLLTVYMQMYQKKTNPAAQSMGAMNVMLYGMPLFSVWIAFSLPAGVGFYWICQALVSFGQTILLNKIYTPEKVAELVAKDKAKKDAKGKKTNGYMQKLLEAQEQYDRQKNGTSSSTKDKSEESDSEVADTEEVKISKRVKKDVDLKVIAEARRRMAEKYGDDYDDDEK